MPNNKQQTINKLLPIIAITCISLLMVDKIIITPLTNKYKKQSQKINKLKTKITKGEALLKQKKQLQQYWKKYQKNSLPADKPTSEAITVQTINTIAEENNILITSLKPRWKQEKNKQPELIINTSSKGDWNNIAKFIFALQTSNLPIALQKTKISANQNSSMNLELQISSIIINKKTER